MARFKIVELVVSFLILQHAYTFPVIGPSGFTDNFSAYFTRLPTKDSPHLFYIYQAKIFRLDLTDTSSLSPVSLGPAAVNNNIIRVMNNGSGGMAALTVENFGASSELRLYSLNDSLTSLTLLTTITVSYKTNMVIVGRGNNILVIPENSARFPSMTKIDFAGNSFQALTGEATVMDRVRTAVGFDTYWLMISAPDVDDQSPGNQALKRIKTIDFTGTIIQNYLYDNNYPTGRILLSTRSGMKTGAKMDNVAF